MLFLIPSFYWGVKNTLNTQKVCRSFHKHPIFSVQPTIHTPEWQKENHILKRGANVEKRWEDWWWPFDLWRKSGTRVWWWDLTGTKVLTGPQQSAGERLWIGTIMPYFTELLSSVGVECRPMRECFLVIFSRLFIIYMKEPGTKAPVKLP